MDFGEILKQWDSMASGGQASVAPSPPAASKQKTPPQQTRSLRKNAIGTFAQDKSACKVQGNAPRKKRNAPSRDAGGNFGQRRFDDGSAPSAIRAAQEKWIQSHITIDKDAAFDEEAIQNAQRSIKYIKSMKPDETLDLHGYTQNEAWARLSSFMDDCVRRGARKVLIIHGKGIHAADSEGVLTGVVRSFIEMDNRCGRSGHPDRKHGGSGATWIILKR